ncbi:MAG: hypothetical protein Unbinned2514contig1000_41 [Prokaryotic dsDNA virus sp.]|nr:MAG: hypothetical protein Unbinned2514contig1000_41 [Prokaryotic dsDNA virus sp.]|tara:strand:+ start:8353 stop:9357 length:1005 start_codon:yes stop_codon:yes gene_type:complete
MKSRKALHTWGGKSLGRTKNRGDCKISPKWRAGKREYGRIMGTFYWSSKSNNPIKNYRIAYVGKITIGMVTHHLGVVAWEDWIFLSRYGEIWRLDGVTLPDKKKVVNPVRMGATARRLWADSIAQMVLDRLTPKTELVIMNEAKRKYHHLVAALVNERCIKAATYGRKRTPRHYAQAISLEWTQHDLLKPREPSLMHALMASLVLALSAEKAADLIKLGAWLEYRVPLFSTESALAIYHNSCWQLSRLCPTWHAESYLCDWHVLGPLDELFFKQFLRVMGVASARDLPVEDIAGCPSNFGANAPEWRSDASRCSSFVVENEERALHRKYDDEEE